MNDKNNSLMPILLQTLSMKPGMCDTYENLCKEIKFILSAENIADRYDNIEKNVEDALDIGKNLGILTIVDDLVRLPTKYNKGSKAPSSSQKRAVLRGEEIILVQPRRTHTLEPAFIPHGSQKKSGPRRSGAHSRSRARSSNRNRNRNRNRSRSRSRSRITKRRRSSRPRYRSRSKR